MIKKIEFATENIQYISNIYPNIMTDNIYDKLIDNLIEKREQEISEKNSEPNISVNLFAQCNKKVKCNVQPHILNFILGLSFDGFVLAGNSVANMIENIEIKGDLDFWVCDKNKYLSVLEEFKSKNPTQYDIYPSMILIKFDELPEVNLILSAEKNAGEMVKKFDFDYCRCYFQGVKKCIASMECLLSIFTKKISNEIAYGDIRYNRILKAIRYGYSFNLCFWDYHKKLLKTDYQNNGDICMMAGKKPVNRHDKCANYEKHCKLYNGRLAKLGIDALNMDSFKQQEFNINISNVNNIEETINTLKKFSKKICPANTNQIMLPKLMTLTPQQYNLVKTYVNRIIVFNPVRGGNYLHISFESDPMEDNQYECDNVFHNLRIYHVY